MYFSVILMVLGMIIKTENQKTIFFENIYTYLNL